MQQYSKWIRPNFKNTLPIQPNPQYQIQNTPSQTPKYTVLNTKQIATTVKVEQTENEFKLARKVHLCLCMFVSVLSMSSDLINQTQLACLSRRWITYSQIQGQVCNCTHTVSTTQYASLYQLVSQYVCINYMVCPIPIWSRFTQEQVYTDISVLQSQSFVQPICTILGLRFCLKIIDNKNNLSLIHWHLSKSILNALKLQANIINF